MPTFSGTDEWPPPSTHCGKRKNGPVTATRPVLIVVDMQCGFVRPASSHIVDTVVDVVSRWQENGGDTVFTKYVNDPAMPFERLLHWTRLRESPEIDIVPALQPYAANATAVLEKRIYTMFTDEGETLVHRHGWTDLFICGIATESCVLKSAVDAFERNLTPWILEDACGSHAGPVAHDAGILVASRFIGRDQIITIADMPKRCAPR
jgi:nicotinamidase-related amidase